jgi:hypothetical protein
LVVGLSVVDFGTRATILNGATMRSASSTIEEECLPLRAKGETMVKLKSANHGGSNEGGNKMMGNMRRHMFGP